MEQASIEKTTLLKLSSVIQKISLRDPFACIGLFGSRASGKARDDSDWDVFIITSMQKQVEAFCKTGFPLDKDVHFEIISLKEFEKSLTSAEETVVKHIIRNKRILYNPYPFYNILRNWELITYAPTQTD